MFIKWGCSWKFRSFALTCHVQSLKKKEKKVHQVENSHVAMGWVMSFLDSHTEALTRSCTSEYDLIWKQSLQIQLSESGVIRVDPNPIWLLSLWQKKIGTEIPIEGRQCEVTGRRQPLTSQGERGLEQIFPSQPSKGINTATLWSQTSSLQNCETRNICRSSRPVYGTLLGQPEQTNDHVVTGPTVHRTFDSKREILI